MGLYAFFQCHAWVMYAVTSLLLADPATPQKSTCEAEFVQIQDVCSSQGQGSFTIALEIKDPNKDRTTPKTVEVLDPQGTRKAIITEFLGVDGTWAKEVEINNAIPGSYLVRYYCSQDHYVESAFSLLNDPLYFISFDPIICAEGRGTISISPARGQELTYQWSTGESTETIEDLVTGIYTVTITNQYGCKSIEDIDLAPATSSAILPSTGSLIIWARDLMEKTGHPYIHHQGFLFSFSSAIADSSMVLNCDHIRNGIIDTLEIEIWMTDADGNQESCTTKLILGDNPEDLCPDSGRREIKGQILTPSLLALGGVCLDFNDPEKGRGVMTSTDEKGRYAFTLSGLGAGELIPTKNDDQLGGVSTKDIVLIQYHLLGKRNLEHAWQHVAGDCDNNQRISVGDMVALRKLILGVRADFPNGQHSWRFHLGDEQLNVNSPFDLHEEVSVEDKGRNTFDFHAIKIGDIDGSYGELRGLATRSNESFNLNYRPYQNGIEVLAGEDKSISGLQMELEVEEGTRLIKGFLDFNESHWVENGGILRMSWTSAEPVEVVKGQSIFLLETEADETKLTQTFNHEFYDDELTTYLIRLEPLEDDHLSLYQNIPNPFDHSTIIPFSLKSPGEVVLSIISVEGRLIHEIKGYYARGEHEIFLSSQTLNATGLMYYRMESGDQSEIRRMIRLRR